MSEKYLKECLERLGWGSGFYLPVANDENRELEKQVHRNSVEMLTHLIYLYEFGFTSVVRSAATQSGRATDVAG